MNGDDGGFDMTVAAESKQVVAILGDGFPYKPSELEHLARQTAGSLELVTKAHIRPTLSWEDEMLVGRKKFSAESGNVVLVYERALPQYNADEPNSPSQEAVWDAARLLDSEDSAADAVGCLWGYFLNGPYEESFALRKYADAEHLVPRAELVTARSLELTGETAELFEEERMAVGADYSLLQDLAGYLSTGSTRMGNLCSKVLAAKAEQTEPPKDGESKTVILKFDDLNDIIGSDYNAEIVAFAKQIADF